MGRLMQHFPASVAFGRLRALGLLDDAEITACLRRIPESGRRMRAMHAYADSHAEHAAQRRRAAFALRTALRPLLEAWRPAAVILGVADRHQGLAPGEARAIAAREAAAHLNRRRRA